MKDLIITDDNAKKTVNGEGIFKKRKLFTKPQVAAIKNSIEHFMPQASKEEREDFFYRYYYEYLVYGFTVDQMFYLHLLNKTHEEKLEYISHTSKFLYFSRLNKRKSMHLLEDKYEAYNLLKPYYKRDIIKIENQSHFEIFKEFVTKHPEFVVKPIDLSNGLGIRKVCIDDYDSLEACFLDMLGSGKDFEDAQDYKWSSDFHAAVLEELIVQDESLAELNPSSVNGVRVTTIRIDGKIHIYHPWIKVAVGGEFVASATLGGFDACIDAETGIVDTNGYLEDGSFIEYHPDTNVKIKGFKIPRWQELIDLSKKVASSMDNTINYVGWDFVLTPNGWVIMEGNFYGDTMWQMCYDKGMKSEFEDLIGWKMGNKFWWQYNMADLEEDC